MKSMKRVVAFALAAVTAMSLAVSCKASPSPAVFGKTTISKQITIGRSSDCLDMDPTTVNDTPAIWTMSLMLEGLVKTNDAGTKIVGDLATGWDISKDGKTYTFHLIKNLKFADGTKVTGADWIWSFQRAMSNKDSYWNFSCSNISSVSAPNNSTVVIKLKAPSASTLSNLTMFNLSVQSKAYYTKKGSYANTAPMGTGPYSLKNWSKGQSMTLAKNTYYHVSGCPKTNMIVFKVVPDDSSRAMQLQAKNLDIIADVPYSSMASLKLTPGIKTAAITTTSNRYLVLNTTDKILKNQKVRQALLYGTDKSQLVKTVLYGYGKAAVSYMPMSGLYWNDKITPAKYSVSKAKELLKQAGYPNGFSLEFLVRSGNDEDEQIATVIKQQWAKIGVNVNLVTLEKAALLSKEYALKHQVLIGSWSDDLADPGQVNDYFWNYDVSKCFYTGYKNTLATSLYNKTKTELGNAARRNMFFQLQNIMYTASPVINLYHSQTTVAMSSAVSGFTQTPLGKYDFDKLVKS